MATFGAACPGSEDSDDDEYAAEHTPLLREQRGTTEAEGVVRNSQPTTCCQKLRNKFRLSPKWQCYKNLAFHSISSFMVFTSFLTFQSLDSSLNAKKGLGVFTFTSLYGGFIVSCIVAPAIVRLTGCKDAMLLCFMAQLIFALTHFYPRFYTLLPSSLLLGLMLGPFWTAQGVYIVSLSKTFSDITGKDRDVIVSRFYGVFNFFIMSSQKFGNLMESLILSKHGSNTNDSSTNHVNNTHPTDRGTNGSTMSHCGASYCASYNTTSHAVIHAPEPFYVNLLIATYAGLCMVGIITKAGLVDDAAPVFPVSGPGREVAVAGSRSPSIQNSFRDVTYTLKVHRKNHMYLLIPLFFYSGLQQGFVYGDYTKAFVACELGISKIGYVMLVYGYADAFSSLLVGCLEKFTGRVVLFTVATLVQTGLVIFMQLWSTRNLVDIGEWIIFAIPGFWGIGDAIWQTTTSSMVGTQFYANRDAAFACFRLWQAAGLGTAFAYSHALCTWIKLYIILGAMICALVSYYTLTCVKRRRRGYVEVPLFEDSQEQDS